MQLAASVGRVTETITGLGIASGNMALTALAFLLLADAE